MMTRLFKLSLFLLCLTLLNWPGLALAQEEPPDRPPIPPIDDGGDGGTNGGPVQDGDESSDGEEGPTQSFNRAVSGYVYDYSGYVWAAGVTVVLDGGGWQAEAVTDTNGYYRISGLGGGRAVLNLRLPPGTHPVVFDWPVYPSGSEARVNLGYYWGNKSPLPVHLAGEVEGNVLSIRVVNQTDKAVAGSRLKVLLPAAIRSEPAIQAGQGSLALYDSHNLEVELGELAAGKEATVEVSLSAVPGRESAWADQNIQLILTYDRQLTPIMAAVAPGMFMNQAAASPAPASGPARAISATPPAAGSSTPIEPLPETGDTPPHLARILDLLLPVLAGLGLSLAGLYGLKHRDEWR